MQRGAWRRATPAAVLDPDFTTLENLLVYARYFGIPRAEALDRAWEVLDIVQLGDKANAGPRGSQLL